MHISRVRHIDRDSESLLLADGEEDIGGGTILTSFQLETTNSFYKVVAENDCVSRTCCAKANWLSVILSLIGGLLIGTLPTVVRSLNGDPSTGDTSLFGLIIYLLYPVVTIPISSLLMYCLNKWIKRAVLALWQFSAFLEMTNPKGSLRFGLSFLFPADTPERTLEWLRFRRTAHRKILSELTKIFPMEVILGPLVALTFLIAITIFINAVGSSEFIDTFNLVGLVLLFILTFYTLAILGIAAYINLVLNEEVIATLTKQKFERSKSLEDLTAGYHWNSGHSSTDVSTLDNENDDNFDDEVSHNSSSDAKESNNAKLLPSGSSGWNTRKVQEIMPRLQEVVNSEFTVARSVMLIDSSIERIRNSDEGVYLKVFGINITFALLLSAFSILTTAISGALSQI